MQDVIYHLYSSQSSITLWYLIDTICCSSSTVGVLKVNTVSNAVGTFSYEVDDPVQVLHSSVELHSAFLYQTPNMVCTISAITVNASVETLPGTSLFTFSLQCFNTYHHTLHLAHALVHLSHYYYAIFHRMSL